MKIIKIIGLYLIVGSFLSCDQEAKLTNDQKYEIINSVKKSQEQFCLDYEAEDFDAVMSHLDTSRNFFWIYPPETVPVTREIFAEVLKREFEMNNPIKFIWDTIQVVPLSSDLAYYQGRFHRVETDTSEIEQVGITFVSAIVIRREEGWKLLSGQNCLRYLTKE